MEPGEIRPADALVTTVLPDQISTVSSGASPATLTTDADECGWVLMEWSPDVILASVLNEAWRTSFTTTMSFYSLSEFWYIMRLGQSVAK